MRRADLIALVLLAGCAPTVTVDTYPTEPGTEVNCGALYADLPPTAGTAPTIPVEDDVAAAAWGDPPVVLRCGVERPAALRQTSRCNMVGDVGWLDEKIADGYLFTTIGREFYVSVEVPDEHAPAADVLIDLSEAITKHDPETEPCV